MCQAKSCWNKSQSGGYCREHHNDLITTGQLIIAPILGNCKLCDSPYEQITRKYADFCSKACGKLVWRLLHNYGLTVEKFKAMLAEQNYVCAICGEPEKSYPRLAVDHNHITGKIRALLCSTCNPGLGCFKEDPALMYKAMLYLIKHGKVLEPENPLEILRETL